LRSVADGGRGHVGDRFTSLLRVTAGSYPAGVLAVVAFAGLATVSIWMASNVSTESTRIANDRFKFKVSQAQFAIRQRLAAYQGVLRGAVGLFAATNNQVTRAAWHTYVNTPALDKNYPGIQGIGFAKHIAVQQRNGTFWRFALKDSPTIRSSRPAIAKSTPRSSIWSRSIGVISAPSASTCSPSRYGKQP